MWGWMFGKKPDKEATVLRSEAAELPPQLDLEGNFRIAMPIIVIIPISPLETFSERVIAEYDVTAAKLRAKVVESIFQPLPNGKLSVYPKVEGEKTQ